MQEKYKTYKAELKNTLTPISNIGPIIENDRFRQFQCMRNVPNTMFDLKSDNLKLLLYFDEEEDCDSGKTHTLFEYKDVYFIIDQSFGSCPGRDDWSCVGENDDEARLVIIHQMIDAIKFSSTIYHVINPNDWIYAYNPWKVKFTSYLSEIGQLDDFTKYINDAVTVCNIIRQK